MSTIGFCQICKHITGLGFFKDPSALQLFLYICGQAALTDGVSDGTVLKKGECKLSISEMRKAFCMPVLIIYQPIFTLIQYEAIDLVRVVNEETFIVRLRDSEEGGKI